MPFYAVLSQFNPFLSQAELLVSLLPATLARAVCGNVTQGRMDSHFKSAREQAGLKAGDGGFQASVARNTALVGGVIASSEGAALAGRNRLDTDTLVVQDVKNTARYKADQIALSGGYSWGGGGGGETTKGDAGKGGQARMPKARRRAAPTRSGNRITRAARRWGCPLSRALPAMPTRPRAARSAAARLLFAMRPRSRT